MSLLRSDGNPKAVHALVIGVGNYPWLAGGDKPLFSAHGGMGQLTSAPASARAFARWFLDEFQHPLLKGRSLDLLLSDADSNVFDAGEGPVAIQRATMSNVVSATLDWANRGSVDAQAMMIFFFCGHGLGRSRQTILLMEDFGQLPGANSLRNALDFEQFQLGMDKCAARQQCFFVDACRVGTPFSLNTLDYFGDPIMIPDADVQNKSRSAPVYYATLPGVGAYGRVGQPSFFTESLLRAFQGAGADDVSGKWRVETDSLHRGIRPHLQRAASRASVDTQFSIADGLAEPFALHELSTEPLVPVDVTCSPQVHNSVARLNVLPQAANSNLMEFPAVSQGDWNLELATGAYSFGVQLPPPANAATAPQRYTVRPPYRRIEVPVP